MDATKTAASALQELMVKLGEQVQYDVVYQGGPPHQMMFKYQCTAAGVSVIASGRSKKEAKQEAAACCLAKLAEIGKYHPPPTSRSAFAPPSPKRATLPYPEEGALDINSYVALMKEFCESYHLPAPEYELTGDSGPPHCRQFAVCVRVGAHSRCAVSSTKKAARQLAAQDLYLYLKENLNKITRDFDEGEALVKANLKAQERYVQIKEETQPWRPNLGQKLSEHHLGLKTTIDLDRRAAAMEIINNVLTGDNLVDKAEQVLKALDLEFEWQLLPSHDTNKVVVVLNVPKAHPSFAVASPPDLEHTAKQSTAQQLLQHINVMLHS